MKYFNQQNMNIEKMDDEYGYLSVRQQGIRIYLEVILKYKKTVTVSKNFV